ncbi:MarR family winged helix-turn-helix transcriptional regulator [Pararhizobium sp. IMCC21322]|uniref:MarR family winged helix-turn-helix transcriptional regulator n=1 Tax=Pararhizobium sp. IMCC21322 TaxID=3067903 RepID=UPI002740753C|nr:MarR family transcriptional regulator [Pararhizobium sp. IMCC21322]
MIKTDLSNIVCAFGLAVSDRLAVATARCLPRDEPAKAIAFIGRETDMTIRALSAHMQLSHAATLRMIDRLSDDGLVIRATSQTDRRAVGLSLTDDGLETYQQLLGARAATAGSVIEGLESSEQEQLKALLKKALASMVSSPEAAVQCCRFCDVVACSECPVNETY